jgi:hypothetical protein
MKQMHVLAPQKGRTDKNSRAESTSQSSNFQGEGILGKAQVIQIKIDAYYTTGKKRVRHHSVGGSRGE